MRVVVVVVVVVVLLRWEALSGVKKKLTGSRCAVKWAGVGRFTSVENEDALPLASRVCNQLLTQYHHRSEVSGGGVRKSCLG